MCALVVLVRSLKLGSVMSKTKSVMQWFQTLILSHPDWLTPCYIMCVPQGFEWLTFVLTLSFTPAKHSHTQDCVSGWDIPLIYIHCSVYFIQLTLQIFDNLRTGLWPPCCLLDLTRSDFSKKKISYPSRTTLFHYSTYITTIDQNII